MGPLALLPCAVGLLLSVTGESVQAKTPLPLVRDGRSDYAVYHAAGAPASVKQAAGELQRVLRVATGVELPIRHTPNSPMIALGDSPSAREAGLVGARMPQEGHRIVTRGASLFIVGHDTPDGGERWFRQVSRGTLFGVYAFLERAAGVRWLVPGPWGEDIPRCKTLVVEPTDVSAKPWFTYRALAYVQGRRDKRVQQWKRRNRVHKWYWVSFGHAWDDHPPNRVLQAHPEYMAMRNDGTRQPVPKPGHKQHKYCITDPGLIQAYGESIAAELDRRPDRLHASMSPSDGAGFCECPRCKALTVTDDKGLWGDFADRGWSVTPAMLAFYNGVARVVGRKHPDRIVGGLVYHGYTYPPETVTPMAPNVVLNIAVLDHYGYKLYKTQRADEFRRLLPAWSTFTRRLAFTDYSTWMRDWYGLPLPPGLEILELTFAGLRDHVPVFVNYTGHSAWGTGGVHNYIVAKLLWDPCQDVAALYREFLERAYGKESARAIDRIYTISDRELARYVRAHKGHRQPPYDATYELVANHYAPHFAEFESLFKQAMSRTKTEAQRKRLAMFGQCLTVLHYNLRCARLVKAPEQSIFYKSHADYAAFLESHTDSLAIGAPAKPAKGKRPRILFAREERKLRIPMLPPDLEAPAVDGRLSEPAWTRAAVADGFRLRGMKIEAGEPTEVRLMFDRDHLYVGVVCRDRQVGKLRRKARKHDSVGLFDDDTFELFFAPHRNYRRYWHIAVNAANARYDDLSLQRKYDLKVDSAAAVGKAGWTVEMAIPFAKLGYDDPPAGQTWRGNFCRVRRAKPREVSSWSVVEEGFHEPESFGFWEFATP